MVPNPILKTHFFQVRKKHCLQIFDILGELMCPTKWHKLRQATDFFEHNKVVKTYLLSKRLVPPSGKFLATAPVFLQRLCRPHQAL